jgi:hypothetical protein
MQTVMTLLVWKGRLLDGGGSRPPEDALVRN